MKKIFYLFLIPILWIGCSKETQPEPSPVGGTISVRSQGELSNEPQGAAEIPGKATNRAAGDVLTYTFEAWTRDGEPRRVLHKTANGTLREAAFEIALIPGNYDFLFWADYGKGAYTTDNLRNVAVAMTSGSTPATYTPGSERDAFACASTGVQWNGGNGVSATLKRPLAKLTMQNTSPFTAGNKQVSVTYRNVPSRYDVLTGMASVPADIMLSFPATTAGEVAVGEDFLLVPSEGQAVGLSITVGDATKRLDALTLQPNYTTNVTASFE